MFWSRNPANSRPKNVRARDGFARRTASQRRGSRKIGGLSARQQKRVIKANRRHNSWKRGR